MPNVSRTGPPELEFLRFWQFIAWLLLSAVVIVSLMPKPPPAPGFLSWDKAQHFVAYAGLMWWFRQVFSARTLWIVFLISVGLMLEFIQGWSGYRMFEYDDAIANALGVGGGLLIAATPVGKMVSWFDRMLTRFVVQ